jgi:methionyl-tRNA formyltransferase
MPRIIFMGTPEFAVPVLDALTRTTHKIVGVYTRPDQPAGRGKPLRASPVKRLAKNTAYPSSSRRRSASRSLSRRCAISRRRSSQAGNFRNWLRPRAH